MFCKVNVFSRYFVFSFVWLVVISTLSSSLFSSIYFSSVIEFFFRCYFRITRRFMLRSQHELNTSRCMSTVLTPDKNCLTF